MAESTPETLYLDVNMSGCGPEIKKAIMGLEYIHIYSWESDGSHFIIARCTKARWDEVMKKAINDHPEQGTPTVSFTSPDKYISHQQRTVGEGFAIKYGS